MQLIIVGCGLTGSVIARELAEAGNLVRVWDRRSHVGGNMFDHYDDHGLLVQQYGPHVFHTDEKDLIDYLSKYGEWIDYKMVCGSTWSGKCSPTPFNFTTVDMHYEKEDAEVLKQKLFEAYPQGFATITDLLNSGDEDIRKYGKYLFEMDYAPYTAKQWGLKASEVDPSILKRVPVRISYEEGYYDDKYQCIPADSFTSIFKRMLDHPNIDVELNVEALDRLIINDKIRLKESDEDIMVIYTGPLDQLFSYRFGKLPYRSLRFEWKHDDSESFQDYPVVAYPQEEGYTRITEYSKLPIQTGKGTTYAVEYPLLADDNAEPYYPVLTQDSIEKYNKYAELAESIDNLYYCGRLGDFKYYDMDEALEHALESATKIVRYMAVAKKREA